MISERDQRIINACKDTDEPIIVFRAQDALTQDLLHYYQQVAAEAGAASEFIEAVHDRLGEFAWWQDRNLDRVKTPDLP